MRPHCWVMVALAGIMSYFSPERALGAPQREGERSRRRRRFEKLSGMLEKGEEDFGGWVGVGGIVIYEKASAH